MLAFVDAVGNPLPAGIQATFTAGQNGPILGTQVLLGFTQIGGTLDPGTSLTDGNTYTVSFFGTQGPSAPITFVYNSSLNPQTLTASAYASPVSSQAGYAEQQTQLWPRGWFSDEAQTVGGIAYNIAVGLASELLDLSQQQQAVIMAARIDTSQGTSIESWVQDFFGLTLPRNSGESDAVYIARAKALIRAKRSTRAGFLSVAAFYGTAWVNEPWRTDQTGAWDTDGTCAWDMAGGWGSQDPLIQAFVETNAGVDAAQMKADLLGSRGLGINTQVISVTPGASGEGWGTGHFLLSHFGVQSQNDGVIL